MKNLFPCCLAALLLTAAALTIHAQTTLTVVGTTLTVQPGAVLSVAGAVGIGTSSPPRAPLDMNGSAFVANHSVDWTGLAGTLSSSITWAHNLVYKPILMLSIDATGGNHGNYIT